MIDQFIGWLKRDENWLLFVAGLIVGGALVMVLFDELN